MPEQISVAIFGIGRAGTIHLQNLYNNPIVKIAYLIDLDMDKCFEAVTKYDLKQTRWIQAQNCEEVFQDLELRAVIICTPTNQHEYLVRSALQHNKAVFCEKPISQDIKITENLYKEAEAKGLLLLCAFNRRFDPSVKALYDKVRENLVGKVNVIKTCSRDNPVPSIDYLKISAGIFHDCAVHDIDMVCWILNEYPKFVFTIANCVSSDIKELGDVDTVLISMNFPSGAIASIDLSRHGVYGYDQRVEVFGSNGMLISENQRNTELVHYSKSGSTYGPMHYSFQQRYRESYVNIMKNFLDLVQNKCPISSITKIEAVNISKIASACEESYRKKQPIFLNDL